MSEKTNRIVILSQYYPPETGAPQNRLSDLAFRFKESGYDVSVLTAKPNYPIGKIYEGYKKGFLRKSVQEGIPVTHCWIYPSNKNLFHRFLNYLSFVFSSIIAGILTLPKIDLILVESPPLFLSISGWVLSRLKGAKMILNISDLYPDTALSLGLIKNKMIINVFYSFEKWSYMVSALVTGQTMGIVESIRTRFPNNNVYLLTNGVAFRVNDIETKLYAEKKVYKAMDFVIGYAGIIGYGQGLINLLSVAKELQIINSKIKFHIYGVGPLKQKLETKIDELSIRNIWLKGHYPHNEILEIMPSWDVGLVPLIDAPLMKGAMPSKMFEMMAMKLPILLIAPQGEASIFLEKSKSGIWIKPDNKKDIVAAILSLFSNYSLLSYYGNNGYKYVRNYYNREKIFNEFISFLRVSHLIS